MGRGHEREARMPGGQLIRLVDEAIAAAAESCLFRCTEHRGRCLVAHIALDLHLLGEASGNKSDPVLSLR